MRYRYQSGDRIYEISVEREGPGYHATVNGEPFDLEILEAQPGELSLRFEGQPVTLYWVNAGDKKWVSLHGCTYLLEKPTTRTAGQASERSPETSVRAPMPAQVRAIQVSEQDIVEKGQTLMLLEAMKMEIRIRAPLRGRITRLLAEEDQSVDRDQILIEIEAVT